MKKYFYLICAALLAAWHTPAASAQDNLLKNPSFEEWSGGQPAGWTAKDIQMSQETSIKRSGNYALKLANSIVEPAYDMGEFTQDVAGVFSQGDVYEATIHYYTVDNGGSTMNRLRLNHRWDNRLEDDEPYYASLPMPVGEWQEYTMEVPVVNGGATVFNFFMNTDPKTVVIVDDFSFRKKEGIHVPFLSVIPEKFPIAESIVGKDVEIGSSIIKYGYLPTELNEDNGTLYMAGSNRDQFKMEVVRDDKSEDGKTGEMELKFTYAPTKATIYSNHTARVTIDSQVEGLGAKSIALAGKAHSEEKPVINTDRSEVAFPITAAGKSRRDTVRITSMNMREAINAVISNNKDSAFFISTNFILVNTEKPQALGIEYRPKKAGTHTATITLSSDGAEPRTITLTGEGTGDIMHPDREGDDYPLDASQPRALLNETFDNVPHNDLLAIDGWKNIAEQNYRAWWGYDFNSPLVPDAIRADEQVAKATIYNSINTAAAPYEMWLYTPALDFKNAASKIFTFRISATMISGDSQVELYYAEPDENEPNGVYRNKVEDIYMPENATDDNDEWFEYHLDLDGQLISDVFFMAFRVSGTGGNASTTSYYLDDVSFGRTDLPKISLEAERIAFESQPGATATTPVISVTADNLAEPIKLALGGSHKSKFEVSTETLPAEGGEFTIQFSSDQTGVHAAYVKLSSRGAADVYLDILVNNQPSNGIDEVSADTQVWTESGQIAVSTGRASQVSVFDIAGHEMASYTLNAGTSTLPDTFGNGIYIVRVVNDLQAKSHKVRVK